MTNLDNPTFRTPEEAARAKEYVRVCKERDELREENARLRNAINNAIGSKEDLRSKAASWSGFQLGKVRETTRKELAARAFLSGFNLLQRRLETALRGTRGNE